MMVKSERAGMTHQQRLEGLGELNMGSNTNLPFAMRFIWQ